MADDEALRAAVALCDVSWLRAHGGDAEASDELWSPYPQEWSVDAEVLFQKWLLDTQQLEAADGADGGGSCDVAGRESVAAKSRYRRAHVGFDRATRQPFAWTNGTRYNVDFLLMTCMEQPAGATRGRVFPLRRLEEGVQTHPVVGKPHPWCLKQARDRESSDWLSNAFFFEAFSKVMSDAGHKVEVSDGQIFDYRYSQDFRGKAETEPSERGGVMYQEPVGWKKFAVRVKGKFDDGDNAWLCLDGRKGEWAVAYHGTNAAAMLNIISGGMRVGERQAYKDFKDKRTGEQIGCGIYCTPNVNTAAEFSPPVDIDGRSLQFVFQCRVRPEAIKRIHEEVGRESGAYWLINDPADIRPYGVLVRGL